MSPFLTGKTVLLTRPRRQAAESRPLFEAEGAKVLIQPVQEILPAETLDPGVIAPEALRAADCVIFSSANGVFFFLEALRAADRDGGGRLILLRKIPLAAVGPGTERELNRAGFHVSVVPPLHSAEGLLDVLKEEARRGKHFLSVRGDRGRNVLKEGLAAAGGSIAEISVYRAEEIKRPDAEIVRLMDSGKIDYTLVTSSATAAGVVRLFGKSLCRTTLVSISPLTGTALKEAGYPAAFQAAEATVEGMLDALRRA